MEKTVTVVGLGLMGGSIAMAVHERTDCAVYGWNRTSAVAQKALEDGVLDGIANDDILKETDLLIVSLYPESTVAYILENLPKLKEGCLIVDLVGVKQSLVERLEKPCHEAGVHYIGGHPMAGREFSGYAFASASLYDGASMILVPTESSPLWAVDELDGFFRQLGFGAVVRCPAAQHDRMIAFTSQLAHVVSSAYIKSPEAVRHNGFSAGSYKDLTRVAKLNETMWTELFLLNRGPLVSEIDEIIHHLTEYRDAIAGGEEETLRRLLKEGREIKESIG